jgi:purine-cytosine permease-like protein
MSANRRECAVERVLASRGPYTSNKRLTALSSFLVLLLDGFAVMAVVVIVMNLAMRRRVLIGIRVV